MIPEMQLTDPATIRGALDEMLQAGILRRMRSGTPADVQRLHELRTAAMKLAGMLHWVDRFGEVRVVKGGIVCGMDGATGAGGSGSRSARSRARSSGRRSA